MRRFKKLITLFVACALILQITASASFVLTKETSVDLWYRIFYSDAARLYPNQKGYNNNLTWPGSTGVHDYSVMNSLKAGTKSVQEVFGSESLNLLFNEGDSVYATGLYLKDEGRIVTLYGMQEWNGFLFVTVGGPAPEYTKTSFTSEDGSTTTQYDTYSRNDGFHAVDGERVYYPGYYAYDNWLYIFDLSKETWYGDCRYVKWSIDDLGLQPSGTPRQVMDDVTVDDDYIYITLNKNKENSSDSTRSVAVFENNIDRDNPVYDEQTGAIKVPDRVEPAGTYTETVTGAVEIVPHSRAKLTSAGSYNSTIINNYLITFADETDIPLAQATDPKKEAVIHVTDMSDVKSGIGETKTHYITTSFNKQSDCSGVFISQLLPIGGGRTWNSVKDAYIRSIIPDGSSIYFLVTYTDTDGSYHQRLFVTDWTNPLKPSLLAQLDYADEIVMNSVLTNEQVINGNITVTNNEAELYYYDGYFYATTGWGLNIIKKYDENNKLNPAMVASYDYIASGLKPTSGYNINRKLLYPSIPTISSIGNCLILNYGSSQNFATTAEARLSTDKTKIEEYTVGGLDKSPKVGRLAQTNITRYGNRIYMGAQGNVSFAVAPTRVEVYDFSKAFPVELSLDQINAKVGAPYTITGGGMGINAVQIKINGEEIGYVNVKKASGKYGTWSYTIEEPGDYTFEAVGATLEGYPKAATAELATFSVMATGELGYDADIDEKLSESGLRSVIISPKITYNTMSGYVDVVPVAAAYTGNKMITMSYGNSVRVEKGQNHNFETLTLDIPDSVGSYTVKSFLFDGVESLSAMADYVEESF